jgi:lipopolysaccharide/colanic/teichoic acid biosynthesis glycosyltransferase
MREHSEKNIAFGVTVPLSANSFLRNQLSFLKKNRYEITLFTSEVEGQEATIFAVNEGILFQEIPFAREISITMDLKALGRLMYAFLKHPPKISNFGTPKAGLLGNLAAWVTRVPARVYTLHGLKLETATGNRRRLLWGMERVAMACAHDVVCVSPSLRDRVLELRLAPAHKVKVLGSGSINGVASYRSNPQITEGLRAHHGLNGYFVIGFVGRFTRDKGISELISVFEQLQGKYQNIKLLMLGDFEDGDPVPDATQSAISSNTGIVRTGFVKDTSAYYPLMDVLVLPTYREGFPLVPLEAASAGIPVVTTFATGARDSVVDHLTGYLVPVGDQQVLLDRVAGLIENPELAKKLGMQGRQWVEENFNQNLVWNNWLNYFDQLNLWADLKNTLPVKRIFDIFVTVLGLILLSIPLLVLAVLIRLKLGNPVLFSQVRPGLAGRPFLMYKFRTMTDQRDQDGVLLADDLRLTSFGAFLRKTSLDELPGLWNVLTGDMSLVGPRPLLLEYLDLYTPDQAKRHDMRPGITGWAQVNGRNAIDWEKKFSLDTWYIQNWSFGLDLKILWLTASKVFKREGISAAGEATMPKFSGSVPPR